MVSACVPDVARPPWPPQVQSLALVRKPGPPWALWALLPPGRSVLPPIPPPPPPLVAAQRRRHCLCGWWN